MEENKNLEMLSDENVDSVVGGYAGYDAFKINEYNKAGVTFEHNVWSKDRYYYEGEIITQQQAEAITKYYNMFGHQCRGKDLYLIKEICS